MTDFKINLTAQISPDSYKKVEAQLAELSKKFAFNGSSGSGSRSSGEDSINRQAKATERLVRMQAQEYDKLVSLANKKDAANAKAAEKEIKYAQMIGNENLKWSKRRLDELDKYQQKINIFNAKNANRDQSIPQVQKSTSVAGSFQQAVSDGDIGNARRLSKELDVANASMQGLNRSTDGFKKTLMDTIKNVGQFVVSVLLMREGLTQLKDGVQYIVDLNKEMTNIQVLQVDGAKTNAEINTLSSNFNKLAKELSATTKEIAQGSTEWLRQGKTIAESQELIRSTMMLSKLGNLEAAEATNDLTSIMNGYKLATEEAEGVVSKLVAVD